MTDELLRVSNLTIGIKGKKENTILVENISFSVNQGEIVGLAGESGCGKSLLCKSLIGLLPHDVEILSGEICFKGMDLTKDTKLLDKIRGKEMTMIFQEPMRTLHPLKTIGAQIGEVLKLHKNVDRYELKKQVIEIMEKVGIAEAERRAKQYPHQLSGGLCQRVIIAIAVIMNPSLIIADEPTTALDVTVQKRILNVLYNLNQVLNTSIVFVSHDLAVISQLCQRAYIMYCGEFVEEGRIPDIFVNPRHPYNRALLNSMPDLHNLKNKLTPIEGQVPHPNEYSRYCRFMARCKEKQITCENRKPIWKKVGDGHVRCVKYE